MPSLDRQTDIIAKGEQLDVDFKTARRNRAFYGMAEDGIVVMEGKK